MLKELTKDDILNALMVVMDPEMDMNIVDLGLVYDIEIYPDYVDVFFTLTTPYCPLEEYMTYSIHTVVKDFTGKQCVPRIVWDPPWSPQRMSEEARLAMGMF